MPRQKTKMTEVKLKVKVVRKTMTALMKVTVS